MIKINDRFEFERQEHCWTLYEWKDGINPKTKEPTRSKTVSYHGNLGQICKEVIDRSAGDADSMQDLLNTIDSAVCDLNMSINSMSTPPEAHTPSEFD